MDDSFYSKYKYNTLLGLLSNGIGITFSAILIPILIRKIGISEWGYYSFFILYIAFMSCLESSIQTYTLFCYSKSRLELKIYTWYRDNNFIYKVLLSLIFILAAILISKIFANILDKYFYLLILAYVNLIFRSISSIYKGNLLSHNSQVGYYKITTIFSVLKPAVLIFTSTYIQDIMVIELGCIYVLVSILECMSLYVFQEKYSIDSRLKLAKINSNVLNNILIGNIISIAAANVDKFLLFIFVSIGVAGEYTFASAISGLLYIFINTATSSIGPKFNELAYKKKNEETIRLLIIVQKTGNLIIMGGIFGYFILSKYLPIFISQSLDVPTLNKNFLFLSMSVLLLSNLWLPSTISVSNNRNYFSIVNNTLTLVFYLIIFIILKLLNIECLFSLSLFISAIFTYITCIFIFNKYILQFNFIKFFKEVILAPLIITLVGFIFISYLGDFINYLEYKIRLLIDIILIMAYATTTITLYILYNKNIK